MIPREPVGSAADEAARLVEAVSGWWAGRDAGRPGQAAEPESPEQAADPDRLQRPEQPEHAEPDAGGHHPSSACRFCPWCRAVEAAQAVRPEVVEQLLGAAESFAAALRELSHDLAADRRPGGTGAPPSRETDHPGDAALGPRTVAIPVEPDHPDDGHADAGGDRPTWG